MADVMQPRALGGLVTVLRAKLYPHFAGRVEIDILSTWLTVLSFGHPKL